MYTICFISLIFYHVTHSIFLMTISNFLMYYTYSFCFLLLCFYVIIYIINKT